MALKNSRQPSTTTTPRSNFSRPAGEYSPGRGTFWKETGHYDRAIVDFEDAIIMDTRSPEAYGGRGEIFSLVGDFNRAIADFTKAIELNTESGTAVEANQEVEYYKNRALAHGSVGNHHQTLTDSTWQSTFTSRSSSRGRNPKDYTLWSLRAIAKAELCMDEEALVEANIAVELGAEKMTSTAASWRFAKSRSAQGSSLRPACYPTQ